MLEKLKENPRVVVAALLSAGVIALLIGANANNNGDTGDTAQDQAQTQNTDTASDDAKDEEAANLNSEPIGREPSAGPVDVAREGTDYRAVVRKGDNQTVVVRQIVVDYLNEQNKGLNAVQRLYMETNIVNTLPRSDNVQAGDVIAVAQEQLESFTDNAEKLTKAQQARWSAYL